MSALQHLPDHQDVRCHRPQRQREKKLQCRGGCDAKQALNPVLQDCATPEAGVTGAVCVLCVCVSKAPSPPPPPPANELLIPQAARCVRPAPSAPPQHGHSKALTSRYSHSRSVGRQEGCRRGRKGAAQGCDPPCHTSASRTEQGDGCGRRHHGVACEVHDVCVLLAQRISDGVAVTDAPGHAEGWRQWGAGVRAFSSPKQRGKGKQRQRLVRRRRRFGVS